MRFAVIDVGTNSTRLLVAEVDPAGTVTELVRRSRVTRLGQGVDSSGRLAPEAVARTEAVIREYIEEIDSIGCRAATALLTSAVRDASDGQAFVERLRGRHGLAATVISGEQEALLTFRGALSRLQRSGTVLVIDVGGGSTEFVVGEGEQVLYHRSLQAGVVRMTERHLHADPPTRDELGRLREDVRETFAHGLAGAPGVKVTSGIAVAGTATSAAAIAQELDPYDPAKVEGYLVSREQIEAIGARLAALSLAKRREVKGLHPDRAPTIVAGMVLLAEALRAFELDQVEVSEHDILYGGLLELAAQEAPVGDVNRTDV